MLIASSSKEVKFHTWPDGKQLHAYKPATSRIEGPVKSISWGKDGTWLVLVPTKGLAEVISVKDSPKHLHSIQEIQQPTCAAFQNATKKNIALGTLSGQVLVYDIKAKSSRKRFPRASSPIFRVEYCAKDTHLLAACENGEILLYSNSTCNLSASYKVPNSRTVSTIRCHPNKRSFLAGGSEEGTVAVWDINSTKTKCHLQAHAAKVSDVAFSPIRSDLIVSLGMDRKFCFYDTVSNSVVFEFSVDRSLTAVDFCHDGVGLAMASLDGTIYSYDTRNMKEPQHNFHGHNTSIKQLLFQKLQQEELTLQYLPESKIEPNMTAVPAAEQTVYDSFGHMVSGDGLGDVPDGASDVEAQPRQPVEDSFMAAMGISNNSSVGGIQHESSLGISEAVKKVIERKPTIFDMSHSKQHSSPVVCRQIVELISDTNAQSHVASCSTGTSSNHLKPISSTPKLMESDLPNFSPIPLKPHQTGSHPQQAQGPPSLPPSTPGSSCLLPADLQNFRLMLKEELKSEVETMKAELRHEFVDVLANMRRQFLDIQMYMVKEFVQLENVINRLRDDLTVDDGYGDDMLVQENLRMRRELAIMAEKLRKKEG